MDQRFDKYKVVKNFMDKDLLSIVHDYLLLQRKENFSEEIQPRAGALLEGVHAVYADLLMEVLLEKYLPKVEEITGKELFPTYSYYRVYEKGNMLLVHRDRPPCEFSVDICIGFDKPWTLSLQPEDVNLNPGDAVIYRGTEIPHWRDESFEGSYYIIGLLHYVDKNGKYKGVRFDGRESLGKPRKEFQKEPCVEENPCNEES